MEACKQKRLLALLTDGAAAAGQTPLLAPQAIEAVPAPFAVGAVGVIGAARAVAPMARRAVQLRVEVALLRPPIAVASCKDKGTIGKQHVRPSDPDSHKTRDAKLGTEL